MFEELDDLIEVIPSCAGIRHGKRDDLGLALELGTEPVDIDAIHHDCGDDEEDGEDQRHQEDERRADAELEVIGA